MVAGGFFAIGAKMNMSELDVVNDCLSTLGELPVNELDDDHNLIAAARRSFRHCSLREQAKQWWYNTDIVTLSADVDGYIYTPADAIRVTPVDTQVKLVQRGRRLYDPGTTGNEATYALKVPSIRCYVVRQVAFEDVPPSMQILIGVASQLKFMVTYDADRQRYQELVTEYQEAYATVNAEHIRNSASNMLESHPTLGRLRQIAGARLGAFY